MASAASAASPTFASTYAQFLEDLEGTFPELSGALTTIKTLPEEDAKRTFRETWKPHLAALAARDAATLFTGSEEGSEIMSGIRITRKLWQEVDDATHKAIWNYLSSLALLSAVDEEGDVWNEEEFKRSMEEMMRGLKTAAEAAEGAGESANPFAAFADMGGLFEKLRDMATGFAKEAEGAAAGAGSAGAGGFKIPERIFKGHIARMAKELADEFKPEDFGISPEMLETNDPAKIFEYLQEIFTKKPDLLMSAAQRIGRKIQAKFQRGEIRREEIIAEVEELMKEFSENEAFNALFGQLGEILQSSAKATGNEGSERRRQVQERLRKKAAEKEAEKARRAGVGTSVGATGSAAAVAAAEAAAAALLAEEAAGADRKASGKKKTK
jgi:hypothetical protein